MDAHQSSATLLMIRPAAFGANPETAATNAFQTSDEGLDPAQIRTRGLAEFDGLARALRDVDVEVLVVEDTPEPETPDAVFPNNWVSFHENGDVFLYPMLAPIRRAEVRRDILDTLSHRYGFAIDRVVDLRTHAEQGGYLEGTGSLVLDHMHRVAYAALSPRTDADLLDVFCREAGYTALPFHAYDASGGLVYHTNVVMCVGTAFAVVCADMIKDEGERDNVLVGLADSGREIVQIDMAQMASFAGNMLEVRRADGHKVLVASTRAFRALREDQRAKIEQHATFISTDLGTIERYGGGSARCMLAEVFLPRR